MGKKAKEHRKKVQKRRDRLQSEQNSMMKMRMKFFEELQRKQVEESLSTPQQTPQTEENPYEIQGPQI